ncbi:SDR family NAD(P)-dependent oxidoreductase [Paenibacillus peoriae]|uniref:SDR family NAD(P)-dependent oxidoreductase n=1 Tax=Paenibacillus peoriae TaxID=59893 RepID=UPI00026C5C75|nr:SDR family NAD(P)-dependent oxidoreductase [Paenibacillus peoriae]MEC0184686.1 SDR family NAD(P)-dependent oxidoreductase [Paenibacillus peoriae]
MGKRLEGKVAIVTGSGQGIGRGIALVLAREGAKVVTNNRKPSGQKEAVDLGILDEAAKAKHAALSGDAEKTAEEIIAAGGEAIPFYGNVADYETARKLVQAAIDKWGRIDILINNAAGLGAGTLLDTSEEEWDYQTIPKLKGSYNTMKHAIPFMIKQGFGRIINIASDAWIGLPGLAAYSAGNAGLVGVSKATAKELAPFGITVNTICPQADSPGHVLNFAIAKKKIEELTGGTIQIDSEKMKAVEAAHGPAENMAPFLAYLSTNEANDINGAVFSVTGDARVTLYTEPLEANTIKKSDGPWSVEELIETVPQTLLKDYVSIVKSNNLG